MIKHQDLGTPARFTPVADATPLINFSQAILKALLLVTQDWQHLAVTVLGDVIRFYENGEKSLLPAT